MGEVKRLRFEEEEDAPNDVVEAAAGADEREIANERGEPSDANAEPIERDIDGEAIE